MHTHTHAQEQAADRILSRMRQATDLINEHRAAEAVGIFQELVPEVRRAQLDSAHFCWAFAVACDNAGELEMAFEQVTQAIAKDPLSPPFRHSFEIIAERLNAVLADPDRAADDESTPRLYALLQRAGAANVAAHLAMAGYHLARGNTAAARDLLAAVTLLHPTSREAWALRAKVARELGDAEAAQAAELEAMAIGDGEPAFAIPGEVVA